MKKIILSLLLVTALVGGCDRYIDSRDPVRSLPDVAAAPTDLRLELNNESITLSWSLPASVTAQRFRIYASEGDTLSYVQIDSTTANSITLTTLKNNVFYNLKVAPVYNGIQGAYSETISTRFGILQMLLANNNEYTNNRSVQAQFSTPVTASYVKISEDPTLADVSFVPFSTNRTFQLSEGDGEKTVYALFQFADGTESGTPVSDKIILDTRSRIDSVYFTPDNVTFAPADTIQFTLDAGEAGGSASISFSGTSAFRIYDDGNDLDAIADDGIYNGWFVVPNNFNLYNGTVAGIFTDRAGNRAADAASFTPLNINTPPAAVELVATFTPGDSARFSWTASNEADFESYRLYSGSTGNVQITNSLVRYETNQGIRYWAIIPGTGTTYYRLFVFDEHGVNIGSNTVSITNP